MVAVRTRPTASDSCFRNPRVNRGVLDLLTAIPVPAVRVVTHHNLLMSRVS